MGHSIKSSATIQQMESCTSFLVTQTAGLSPEREATNASPKAIPVLLSHPFLHLSALSLRKSTLPQIALLIALPRQCCHPLACSTCSPVLPPHASRSILPSEGRMFGWPYKSCPLGLCTNVPRTWAPPSHADPGSRFAAARPCHCLLLYFPSETEKSAIDGDVASRTT
jgi:hypothetical protein